MHMWLITSYDVYAEKVKENNSENNLDKPCFAISWSWQSLNKAPSLEIDEWLWL